MPVEESIYSSHEGCSETEKPQSVDIPIGISLMTRTRAVELITIAKETIEFAEAKGVTQEEFCYFGELCNEMQKFAK